MRYRVLAALAVLVLASCGGTPAPRWNVNDIGDPAQALVEVEARWRADLKQRGGSSTIHPDGRCYIHLSTSGEPGDISTSHPVLCGPVAHWVGRVEPATPQTPTAHVDGIPQFDATYVPPTAHEGRWDVYQWAARASRPRRRRRRRQDVASSPGRSDPGPAPATRT